MNKKMKYVYLVMISYFLVFKASSQTTNVKILDFSVSLQYKTETVISDSVVLLVNFKINKANKAAKAYFFLGTAQDSSNILVAEPVFITSGSTTTIMYNDVSSEVKNYNSTFQVKTTRIIYESFTAATLFVETVDGPLTSRLYFIK